jgi:hypothetical protein
MDPPPDKAPLEILIVALPETAGSALYGMIDVLGAAGMLWRQLVGEPSREPLLQPRIVALSREPFRCGNGIPVCPDFGLDEDPAAGIVILPELWMAPDDDMQGHGIPTSWSGSVAAIEAAASSIPPAAPPSCLPRRVCSTAGRPRHTGHTRSCFGRASRTSTSSPSRTSVSPTKDFRGIATNYPAAPCLAATVSCGS